MEAQMLSPEKAHPQILISHVARQKYRPKDASSLDVSKYFQK